VICEVDMAWLHGRGHEIGRMLSPLTGPRTTAHDIIASRSEVIIAAFSGLKPITDYRSWRFNTVTNGIHAGYFERWNSADEKRTRFYLDRAYLHLYWQPRALDDEKELLALHCDPNEPEDAGLLKHALYKRGPHIHVSASEQPLPHSHFALNADHLGDVLASAERLSRAVASGMVLVRDQVLDLYDSTP